MLQLFFNELTKCTSNEIDRTFTKLGYNSIFKLVIFTDSINEYLKYFS
jgi:hypothetical protein